MFRRIFGVLIITAVLFFVISYVQELQRVYEKKLGFVMGVVTANRDLGVGEILSRVDFRIEQVPKFFLQPNAMSLVKGAPASQFDSSAVGYRVKWPIFKGEQISSLRLSKP